ncbi:hypothetical protein CALVIDRAFT_536300 [Calocera viscosa TUFC12733]|uniref:Uncharacterized protein n=1 Tax=Calocera viscosa (strain TUFC12733) TaxID=1330018 RepID=A0A167N218_CALVF|nr:hypothetical protein CALVIDRAFT_536300 [Calocera viscosa TUFC12733]
MGGFTKPRDLRATNWWPGGAYLVKNKLYERPAAEAYVPYTVYLLETRYKVRYGQGRPAVPEHVVGMCPADVFPALLKKMNSTPHLFRQAMDNAIWPFDWQFERKKTNKWWANIDELVRFGVIDQLTAEEMERRRAEKLALKEEDEDEEDEDGEEDEEQVLSVHGQELDKVKRVKEVDDDLEIPLSMPMEEEELELPASEEEGPELPLSVRTEEEGEELEAEEDEETARFRERHAMRALKRGDFLPHMQTMPEGPDVREEGEGQAALATDPGEMVDSDASPTGCDGPEAVVEAPAAIPPTSELDTASESEKPLESQSAEEAGTPEAGAETAEPLPEFAPPETAIPEDVEEALERLAEAQEAEMGVEDVEVIPEDVEGIEVVEGDPSISEATEGLHPESEQSSDSPSTISPHPEPANPEIPSPPEHTSTTSSVTPSAPSSFPQIIKRTFSTSLSRFFAPTSLALFPRARTPPRRSPSNLPFSNPNPLGRMPLEQAQGEEVFRRPAPPHLDRVAPTDIYDTILDNSQPPAWAKAVELKRRHEGVEDINREAMALLADIPKDRSGIIDVKKMTDKQIETYVRLSAAGAEGLPTIYVPPIKRIMRRLVLSEEKKAMKESLGAPEQEPSPDAVSLQERRKQYKPLLAEKPFFRPLLSMTLPTRPIAASILRLSKSLTRGLPYYAAVSSDDRKHASSFGSRMREMRLTRMRGLCIDAALRLQGHRGGFVGLRLTPGDLGRGINGEGLEWEYQGKIPVYFGSFQPRLDEQMRIWKEEEGSEICTLGLMDEFGLPLNESQKRRNALSKTKMSDAELEAYQKESEEEQPLTEEDEMAMHTTGEDPAAETEGADELPATEEVDEDAERLMASHEKPWLKKPPMAARRITAENARQRALKHPKIKAKDTSEIDGAVRTKLNAEEPELQDEDPRKKPVTGRFQKKSYWQQRGPGEKSRFVKPFVKKPSAKEPTVAKSVVQKESAKTASSTETAGQKAGKQNPSTNEPAVAKSVVQKESAKKASSTAASGQGAGENKPVAKKPFVKKPWVKKTLSEPSGGESGEKKPFVKKPFVKKPFVKKPVEKKQGSAEGKPPQQAKQKQSSGETGPVEAAPIAAKAQKRATG